MSKQAALHGLLVQDEIHIGTEGVQSSLTSLCGAVLATSSVSDEL